MVTSVATTSGMAGEKRGVTAPVVSNPEAISCCPATARDVARATRAAIASADGLVTFHQPERRVAGSALNPYCTGYWYWI